MASQIEAHAGNSSTITCPTCDYTVAQAPGTKRTICPNCGNFYDQQAAHTLRFQHNTRAKEGRYTNNNGRNDKERPGGRLQTIANFFSFNSSKNEPPGQTKNTNSLPPIGPENSKNQLHVPSYSTSRSSMSSPNTNRSSARSRVGQASSPRDNAERLPRPKTAKSPIQLKNEIALAKETGSWKEIGDFYTSTFDSFTALNTTFKMDSTKDYRSTEEPGLKLSYVNVVYDLIPETHPDIQKSVLKCIINSLLKDQRPHTKDDLRAYLILMQNPQFNHTATYVIFAHLLRQVAALSDHDHHYMVHWLKKLDNQQFKGIVVRLHSFITCRLFPPKKPELPALSKCTWWVPSATKVMALLNAANNMMKEMSPLTYLDFYNPTLDHLDLMAEYYAWQSPSSHAGFSFCQYPFILSIGAKRTILQRDSEQQMIVMARRSLVAKVQRRQLPDIGMLFLNLTVRRSHLVSDSLNEVSRKQHDLKKKLKVTFAGEPGLDMGGLTKEWFLLLIRRIFRTEYGMFVYNKSAGVYWFNSAQCDSYQEFNLVGVLMGLAVYNSIILDIRFPQSCYKKLLSPAVVPYSNPRATVGITKFSLTDLKLVQPEVASGLENLLAYEGDVEEDFCLTFEVSQSEHGHTQVHTLKPAGENIPVNAENRTEYVDLYVDWVLNKGISQQFQAFYHGFHSVCASNALIMLRPEEVEMLVCGNPKLDLSELKTVTVYEGFTANDTTIRYFWDTVLNFSKDLQKKLLLFATGSDRIPIGGMTEMLFKITKVEGCDLLPMSHTCFNQLVLPPYKTRKLIKQKLLIAIQNGCEGFGLE